MDLYEYYEKVMDALIGYGYTVDCFKPINFGVQFNAACSGKKGLVRIYQNKKGFKIDFSQVKDADLAEELSDILNGRGTKNSDGEGSDSMTCRDDPDELIGTDESGKGDYFGPLVIAGAYGNPDITAKLKRLGVTDSKKLTDKQIKVLAPQIKELCPHSIVVIGNEKYNEIYSSIKNLNKLLAWGHARVIENMAVKVDCKNALSDQFGDPSLIKSALMEKGKTINLSQRPRAEENLVVAAASILARNEFVERMEEMGERYGTVFPKGASSITIDIAKQFVDSFGMEELCKVAKLHFKTTSQLII